MPEEHSLILHMHELLQFLNRRGAATFLTVAQHGLLGAIKTPVDVTYLADNVLLLRFFEAGGRVRRAISRWSVDASTPKPTVKFHWEERGGPVVAPPSRKGFGSVLLARAVGSLVPPRFDYSPEGFSYELRAVLAEWRES